MIGTNANNMVTSTAAASQKVAGKRFVIAGGGTGGHIFPAIAIANALKRQMPDAAFLFVGAKGKMEMEKIPQAGYQVEGLNIAGFNRSSWLKNLSLPFKLVQSFVQVNTIFKRFKPDAVIGVGGYSSFPVLRSAQAKGIPTFIHESNAFAGKANMQLGRKATKIFVATSGMERFFPNHAIVVTGNPVRQTIAGAPVAKDLALEFFGLQPGLTTILSMGGSLGASSINHAVEAGLDKMGAEGFQVIWQTGVPFEAQAKRTAIGRSNIWVGPFIKDIEMAYAAADVVISRAGAMSVAEISVAGKPAVFVPYPFAAEDHQSFNAKALADQEAGIMIKDGDAKSLLIDTVIALARNPVLQATFKTNILRLATRDADERIATEIINELNS